MKGFNLALCVNFVDGGDESEALVFVGSEGTMEIGWNTLSVSRTPREKEPGYTINTFPEAMEKRVLEAYHQKYLGSREESTTTVAFEKYDATEGYSDKLRPFQELLRRRAFAAARRGRRGLRFTARQERLC